MKKNCSPLIVIILCLLTAFPFYVSAQLKSIVYDFDGLDLGQTNLPEGDFKNYDMQYSIAQNPITAGEMLGDRVLKCSMIWNTKRAQFGKSFNRFVQLNASEDRLNFYIYNPLSNTSDSRLEVLIGEDDNKNDIEESTSDDKWKRTITIPRSSSWQLISLPLNTFTDVTSGGNGVFDAGFINEAGRIFKIVFDFYRNGTTETSHLLYLDMICFSQGALNVGNNVTDLPPSNNQPGQCLLGAFSSNMNPETTGPTIQGLFPNQPKKIEYVNWFIAFNDAGGTTPNNYPGNEVAQILQQGHTPLITWEPLYSHLERLDSRQPRLNDLLSGQFDNYINTFADKLKAYNDTIIVRLMHEFEGDWYPWSLVYNGQDPNRYINTYRKFVNMVRARGATKVKWMWCVNASYHPIKSYNWIIDAYPGNSYVDIVATEAYNLSIPGVPDWRSFRAGVTETYYYLSKYIPSKPLFICENGCRERYSSENSGSQSKSAWLTQMDKELHTLFTKFKALIFFSIHKGHDYRINSSTSSLTAVRDNIWSDNYYFKGTSTNLISVNITSPANNAQFTPGSTINISANASAGSTAITKVEFYNGSTKLGEDLSSPYAYSWTNAPTGTHALTAKAYTSTASSTSSVININVAAASSCASTGSIKREVWNNIPGDLVSSIPTSYSPSSISTLTLFEGPKDVADNYGARIRGYVCPPVSGNYIFWISSNNNSELWLSTNDSPSSKVKIASVTGYTNPREWTKYASQKSVAINLVAGTNYYIEALHKDGTQGDHVAVGWQLPNGTQERPIPGSRLIPYAVSSSTPQVSLTSPANGTNFSINNKIILQATASDANGISKVEFYANSIKIGEDYTLPYAVTWQSPSKGNYSVKAVALNNQGNTANSSIVGIIVTDNIKITRGPYLQRSSSTSMTIRWKTNVPSDTKIKFGKTLLYGSSTASSSQVTDHQITFVRLSPNTKYYYQVISNNVVLQGDSLNFFKTHPPAGSELPIRIWAIGDAGTGAPAQNQVRDAFYNYTDGKDPDVWLWLGDNAYQSGTETEYQNNVFTNHYEGIMKHVSVWPAAGNHDLLSANASSLTGPYYQIFSLPRNGESGGVASGTEAYYSFDYGNAHFVCLESTTASFRASNSAMVNWLKNDLAANTKKWTIVYFHHPPYSKGNHNSDIEIELKEMRMNIVPVLEAYQVDLVVSGHSHCYERSYLIKGHYLTESSFTQSMKVMDGSGSYPTYYKTSPDKHGTIYTVCGASGQVGGTSSGYPHDAMYYSSVQYYGSLVIDIHGDTLKTKFLSNFSSVKDEFGIIKTSSLKQSPPNADPTIIVEGPMELTDSSKTILRTLYSDNTIYQWKLNGLELSGATGHTLEVTQPGEYEVRTIQDGLIAWSEPVTITGNNFEQQAAENTGEQSRENHFKIYPNPTNGNFSIDVCFNDVTHYVNISLIDGLGTIVYETAIAPSDDGCIHEKLNLYNLSSGIYVLRVESGDKVETAKVFLSNE